MYYIPCLKYFFRFVSKTNGGCSWSQFLFYLQPSIPFVSKEKQRIAQLRLLLSYVESTKSNSFLETFFNSLDEGSFWMTVGTFWKRFQKCNPKEGGARRELLNFKVSQRHHGHVDRLRKFSLLNCVNTKLQK